MLDSPWIKEMQLIPCLAEGGLLQQCNYRRGSWIARRSEMASHLFYLLSGKVKVIVLSKDGKEKTLSVHEKGSFVGESPFFTHTEYTTDIIAETDVSLYRLGWQEINYLIAKKPEFSQALFASMGVKIRVLVSQVEKLSFLDIRSRLASVILGLVDEYGERISHNSARLEQSITDQELGNILGVRREVVTKALSRLRTEGIVEKNRRELTVLDVEGLQAMIQ